MRSGPSRQLGGLQSEGSQPHGARRLRLRDFWTRRSRWRRDECVAGGRGRPQEGGFARSVRAWHGSTSRLHWWLRKSMREWTFAGLYGKMLPVEADKDHHAPPAPSGNLPPQHPPRQCRAHGAPSCHSSSPSGCEDSGGGFPMCVLVVPQNTRKATLSVADRALPAWGTR